MPPDRRFLAETFARADFALSDGQIEAFARYAELLVKWNAAINLTAIRDEREIVVKHFLDSALALRHAPVEPEARLADIGSGAGFPGIPTAILRSDLRIDLFEASEKKTAFLRAAAAELRLERVAAHAGRIQPTALSDPWIGAFDGVLSRYTASLGWLVSCAARMARPGGWLLAHKYDDTDERDELRRAQERHPLASVAWIADERAVERRRFAFVRFAG